MTDDATKQLDDFFNHHSSSFETDFENFMKKLHSAYEETVRQLQALDLTESDIDAPPPAPAPSASQAPPQ